MARRYTRDNRGRFASAGGGGATARGGRLRTAAGNKRKTQTMRAQGAGGAGVIKGRAARTVAGQKVMGKLPKAAPKAVVTAKGARIGGGKKVVSVGVLRTNKELGRRGMVGMSASRKAQRRSDVTERRMEKLARVQERGKPSEMMARRRNSTVPTYSPDGKFNQLAANLNQKKAARTKALAERNAYAAQGLAAATASLNRKPKAKPAAPAKAKAAPKGRQSMTFEQATAKSARVKKRAAMVASGEWARPQNRYKAQETGRKAMMVASGNIMAERPRFSTVSNPAPKPKKSRRLSKSERDHRDMLKLAPRMFR